MALTALRGLFGRVWRAADGAGSAAAVRDDVVPSESHAAGPCPCGPATAWPPMRVALAEQLWGEGFLNPGGGAEVVRLAMPMGLSAATTLLLLGAGAGGPPRVLAAELGVWVSAYESEPALVALAAQRVQRAGAGVAKHASVEAWDQAAPHFRAHGFQHAIAFDALQQAGSVAVLAALGAAVEPGGQLVLQEVVADAPLDPADPAIAAWCMLEGRVPALPTQAAITAELRRLRFDVRVAEDESRRHVGMAVQGWKGLVHALEGAHPSHLFAAALVNEAELWARRIGLMHAGRIRLVRWHAYARA